MPAIRDVRRTTPGPCTVCGQPAKGVVISGLYWIPKHFDLSVESIERRCLQHSKHELNEFDSWELRFFNQHLVLFSTLFRGVGGRVA